MSSPNEFWAKFYIMLKVEDWFVIYYIGWGLSFVYPKN
jgi:hypothetical protein